MNRRLRSRAFWLPGALGYVHSHSTSSYYRRPSHAKAGQGAWVRARPLRPARYSRAPRVGSRDRRRKVPRARNQHARASDASWRAVDWEGMHPRNPHSRPPTLSKVSDRTDKIATPGTARLGCNPIRLYQVFGERVGSHLDRLSFTQPPRRSIAGQCPFPNIFLYNSVLVTLRRDVFVPRSRTNITPNACLRKIRELAPSPFSRPPFSLQDIT